jgi:methyl-accepting chemotaxis protein
MNFLDFRGDAKPILDAVRHQQSYLELALDGTILAANEVYCALMQRDLATIKGQHHSALVSPALAASPEYKAFLGKIARGETFTEETKRVDANGREVWLQVFYAPVLGRNGAPRKVVALGVDVTAAKQQFQETAEKFQAVSQAQPIVEYALDGTLIDLNDNFAKLSGYPRDKALGLNHRTFVDPAYAQSNEYREFWNRLRAGERIVQVSKRISASGEEMWTEAAYNPILGLDGRVVKVVNFLTNVTDRVGAVTHLGEALSRLADGDLRHRIETAFAPALEPVRVDFNKSMDSLEKSMASVAGGAKAILAAASEITSAADDLSQRTEQQASSLEETAAALEEITTTVKKAAEGAEHARQIVSAAKLDADKSGAVVRDAMAAMTNIDKSSKEINQIISVIDEIAFQTNLLALNAGVEAARAGEAGRGFAVVASEVRALAQRSAEAAKEIKGLISTSTGQVDQGVLLVTQTGQALERIVAQVVDINTVVTAIAASAQEQATGLQQVNTAIATMDQVTQKNAAMVEETTAASHALATEATELARQIEHYQIREASEDPLRRELKQVAPHAFRERQAKPAAKAELPARAKPAPTRRPASKAVAGGGARAVADGRENDWTEF